MNFDKVNNTIREKSTNLKARLQASIASQGIKHRFSENNLDPLTKISIQLSKQFGVYNRIRVRFKKSGVFVHKGVGRGTTAAQAGSTNRKAKPWFNPVVEAFVDDLAEAVADEMVDITVNSLTIK